mgnify:CR=1 FL=1
MLSSLKSQRIVTLYNWLYFFEIRLYLAGLHYIENSGRDQMYNRQGEACFTLRYPKGRKGQAVVYALTKQSHSKFLYHCHHWQEMYYEDMTLHELVKECGYSFPGNPNTIKLIYDRPHNETS